MKRNFLLIIFFTTLCVGDVYSQSRAQTPSTLPPIPGEVATDFWGINMVYVPSGEVVMGITREELEKLYEELEISSEATESDLSALEELGVLDTYSVEVTPFWIDQYEVTIEEFSAYCERFGCESLPELLPERPQLYADGQQPRLAVTWYEAQMFCEWRLARLPTEAEWEYAASGPDSLAFPWGNFWDESYKSTYIITHPVGSISNFSWIGAYDMSGNLSEWIEDRPNSHLPEETQKLLGYKLDLSRIIRGGSYGDPAGYLTTFNRTWEIASATSPFIGFRCARSSDPRE